MIVDSLRRFLADERSRWARKGRKYKARWTEWSRPAVLEVRGRCPICDRAATFVAHDPWLRDSFKCTRCRSIPRERALMVVLENLYPNWRRLTIHESSPIKRGASRRLAAECPRYIPSQFFSGHSLGSVVNGVRCENLEALTFPASSVDLHVTQDVFEHVLRPEKAFAEIARTLRPGGAHVFTVPIVNRDTPSVKRVAVGEYGEVTYLQQPTYHASPVDPGGSLVTVDWGFDIVDAIGAACGLKTEVHRLDDLSQGIRAEYLEVLVTTKPLST